MPTQGGRDRAKRRSGANGGSMQTGVTGRFPIDDLTYDLLTVMHAKAKALEAYDKYIEDARDDEDLRRFLEQLREQDVRMVHELRGYLAHRLKPEPRGQRAD